MTIVDNYVDTTVEEQDNMYKFLPCPDPNLLFIGSDSSFTISICGINEEDVADIEFIYKDGIIPMFVKKLSNDEIKAKFDEENHILTVKSTLTSAETSQFKFNRKATAQLKLLVIGDEKLDVVYSKMIKLKSIATIDKK